MTRSRSGAARSASSASERGGLDAWVDALLLTARELEVAFSPEGVRGASAWANVADRDDAIVDIALAAGLAAQFVDISVDELSPALLPALLPVGEKYVGVVTAIRDGHATVAFSVNGAKVERSVPLRDIGDKLGARLLLAKPREAARNERLDAHLARNDRSWIENIFQSNWRTLAELGVGSLFGNLLAIGTSLFAMQVWDRVVPARSTSTLWVLACGVALALVLELLIRTARLSIADHFGKKVDLDLSTMFFARALDIRSDARPRSPGTLIAQLRDLEQLRELLTSSAIGVLLDLPFVFAFLFIIFVLGGWLVLVPLAAIPLLILPGVVAQFPLARLSQQGMSESASRNAVLMESIYRIEDIKLLQAESRFRNVWSATNRVNGEIGLQQRFLAGVLVHFAQMAQQLAYVGVIIGGVYGILDGSLSYGAVLACSILTSRAIAPLAQISSVLGRVQNARVGKKGLDQLLSLPVDHDPDKDAYHKPSLVGRYRFEGVVYAYGPDEKPALVAPRLVIEPGERIAVLGRVGAGKSTLLRLAGGLATPIQGRILFNETAMPLIDVADVRRDIGFVLQESGLFYGTLRENLLLGHPRASDEQILEAMRLSCADQLLLNQSHGLDLKLRENGQGLSGGQKQSLLLARVFLRAPNILLLDEPTASLDEATERVIIERMAGWLGQRTLIVATHRYSVLSLVDRIIVVDGGRIAMDGPKHEVLSALSRNGAEKPGEAGVRRAARAERAG